MSILEEWSSDGDRRTRVSQLRKVPEGLMASPSGGPNGSTTSPGTRPAYRFCSVLA